MILQTEHCVEYCLLDVWSVCKCMVCIFFLWSVASSYMIQMGIEYTHEWNVNWILASKSSTKLQKYGILNVYQGYHTSVSGAFTKEYLFNTSMRAAFTMSSANLIPMQLRGPNPKGIWQRWGRLARSSALNLLINAIINKGYTIKESAMCIHASTLVHVT